MTLKGDRSSTGSSSDLYLQKFLQIQNRHVLWNYVPYFLKHQTFTLSIQMAKCKLGVACPQLWFQYYFFQLIIDIWETLNRSQSAQGILRNARNVNTTYEHSQGKKAIPWDISQWFCENSSVSNACKKLFLLLMLLTPMLLSQPHNIWHFS